MSGSKQKLLGAPYNISQKVVVKAFDEKNEEDIENTDPCIDDMKVKINGPVVKSGQRKNTNYILIESNEAVHDFVSILDSQIKLL